MKNLALALMLLVGLPTWAAVFTRVEGTVTFADKPVTVGMELDGSGELVTGPESRAVLKLAGEDGGEKSEILITPRTRLQIDKNLPLMPNLLQGTVRARLQEKVSKGKFKLRTPATVMAVRGTDFLTTFQPLLSESEIVVFEGKVRFGSLPRPNDAKEVGAGYWGGVGGRYGQRIGDLMKLPPSVLQTFNEGNHF